MALRITDVDEGGLAQLNRELQRFDDLSKRARDLDLQLSKVRRDLAALQKRREVVSINNLTFTWDGPGLKLTWVAGFVRDQESRIYPVAAGERTGLAAATQYWLGWNPKHRSMSVDAVLSTLQNIKNVLIICKLRTGTGAQTATAGGGGSDTGGSGPSGKEYLLL